MQIGSTGRGQLRLRPLRREARIGIETAQIDLADGGPVVIAGQAHVRKLAQAGDALVGIGAVADDIAETPDQIEVARIVNDGVQCGEVGVDVRQN